MAVLLKHRDEEKYLKSYNGVTGDIQFTDKQSEAKSYSNDWFAKAELEHLQFHFPEEKETLDKTIVYFT